jgi:hypothetical protein
MSIVGTFAIFIYAHQLAQRIPDYQLARNTRIVMWGLVVTYGIGLLLMLTGVVVTGAGVAGAAAPQAALVIGAGCILAIGSLVFAIWSIVLLFGYRRHFHDAARDAQTTWGATHLQ